MQQLASYAEWEAVLMASIYAVARDGGGRILVHRGGPGCKDTFGGSCPCGPGLVVVGAEGTVR